MTRKDSENPIDFSYTYVSTNMCEHFLSTNACDYKNCSLVLLLLISTEADSSNMNHINRAHNDK